MNRIKMVIVVISSAAFGCLAEAMTTTFTGGGSFSVGTWSNGKPVADGTRHDLTINVSGNSVSVENDIEGLLINSLTISNAGGADKTVTLMGCGFGSVGTITANCQATVKTPIATDQAKVSFLVGSSSKLILDADVICTDDTTAIAYGGVAGDAGFGTYFNKAVYAPKAVFSNASAGGYVAFKGEVTAAALRVGQYWQSAGYAHFLSGDIHIAEFQPGAGTISFETANILSPDTILTWKEVEKYVKNGAGYAATGTYLICKDQTVDRLSGTVAPEKTDGSLRNNMVINAGANATRPVLTIKPSQSATCYAALGANLGLVLEAQDNSCTQEFQRITHPFDGPITVKKGVLAFSGDTALAATSLTLTGGKFLMDTTLSAALSAVTALALSGNSSVEFGSNTVDPFGSKFSSVAFSGTSYLSSANALTITATAGSARGVYLKPGAYCAIGKGVNGETEVDWLRGEARVVIESSIADGTYWKEAASGDWNDPEMWTDGVPTKDSKAYVMAGPGDYTVTVRTGDVMPDQLFIGNDGDGTTVFKAMDATFSNDLIRVVKGGRIEVPTDGKFYYNGYNENGQRRSAWSVVPYDGTVQVRDGGEFLVSGGAAKFERFTGYFTIGRQSDPASAGMLRVAAGRFEFSRDNYFDRIGLNAGGSISFGEGTTVVLDGSGCFCGPVDTNSMKPKTGSDKGVTFGKGVVFEESNWSGTGNVVYNLSGAVQKMVPESFVVADVADKGVDSPSVRCLDNTLNVSDSVIGVSGHALEIAGSYYGLESVGRCESAKGEVNLLNGGVLNLDIWNTGIYTMPGLVVGWGAHANFDKGTRPQVKGYLNVGVGSAVTNKQGFTVLGAGHGMGEVSITGGNFVSKGGVRYLAVGCAGGRGRMEVSSGLLSFEGGAYVGGVPAARLPTSPYMVNWGFDLADHTAEGSFVQRGGDISFGREFVLGADGAATLERVGSEGTFTIDGDLVFSNATANAASGAIVKFTFDANGVGPVSASGKLVLGENAKLVVDTADYPVDGKPMWLIQANGLEGAFSTVELSGEFSKKARLRVSARGVKLGNPAGLVVIVK